MWLSSIFQAKSGWWFFWCSLFFLLQKLGGHWILYDEGYMPASMVLKCKINYSLEFIRVQSLSVVVMDEWMMGTEKAQLSSSFLSVYPLLQWQWLRQAFAFASFSGGDLGNSGPIWISVFWNGSKAITTYSKGDQKNFSKIAHPYCVCTSETWPACIWREEMKALETSEGQLNWTVENIWWKTMP